MRMLHTSYQRFYVKGHFQYCTDAIDSKHIKVKHPSNWTPCSLITGCNRNKWHIYKTSLRDNGEENNTSTIIAITSHAIFVSSHQTNVHINTYCNACLFTALKLLVMGGIRGSNWVELVSIVFNNVLCCQRCWICKKVSCREKKCN
jgi:hypothetical protein